MNAPLFPDISRVFSKQRHVPAFSRLLDAAAFPIIGNNGPQVSGMMDCESLQPFPLSSLFHI